MSDATQITGMGTMAQGAFTRIDPYAREVTYLGRQRHGRLEDILRASKSRLK